MDSSHTNMFGVPIPSSASSAAPPSEASVVPEHRSSIKRIALILIPIILFLGGVFFLYVAWLSLVEQGIGATIIPGVLGIILAGGGIMLCVSGLRK